MAVHFHKSSAFEKIRAQIEHHLFDSVLEIENDMELALRSVHQFALAIERLIDTLEQMYQTPGLCNHRDNRIDLVVSSFLSSDI